MKQLSCLTIALCASVALTLTTLAGPEPLPSGKEMKEVAPAPPSCDYSWSGFYFGLNGGYGWGNNDTHFEPLPDPVSFRNLLPQTLDPDPNGFVGGGQFGYNFQWNWLVFGPEVDIQRSDMDGTAERSPFLQNTGALFDGTLTAHSETDWFGTARLRLGVAPFCHLLVYGTGGVAFGDVTYFDNSDFTPQGSIRYPARFTHTSGGWCGGGGIEYALSRHWSIKAEYLYYDLGNESFTAKPVPPNFPFRVRYDVENTANIVRGGINFKF